MIIESFGNSFVICADSTSIETVDFVSKHISQDNSKFASLIIADPPYGNVVRDDWDKVDQSDDTFSDWMCDWTKSWNTILRPGGAFYVWGGTGSPGFRPFFKYLTKAESVKTFELANLITWKKRRGYGVQKNYLYTREELAYFINGRANNPAVFNIPYLEEIRGYPGFNKKYPAKDARYRRSNVWTDITEIMQGKRHVAQKKLRLAEIPIEIHTAEGDWVIDPFAGSGSTAEACIKLNRRFVVIEKNYETFMETVKHLRKIQ